MIENTIEKLAWCDGYQKGKEELEKENAELKAELKTAQECIVLQQKDYEILDKKYTEWFTKYHEQIVTVSEQKKQIEKMKNCKNCKFYKPDSISCYKNLCYESGSSCPKEWELAEN